MVSSDSRLPRFSRFEYILDVLSAVHESGVRGSELASVRKALSSRKELFEQAKLRAVGKGKSMNKGTDELTRDCVSFAVKSGLARFNDEYGERLLLTDLGMKLLTKGKEYGISGSFLTGITSLYLSTYKSASAVLLAILRMDGCQVDIPDTRHGGRLSPEQIENILGARCDAVSLISLRLLLDQAQLINWFTFTGGEGRPVWRIYATCNIGEGEVSFRSEGIDIEVKINDVNSEVFEETAWSEYMKLADNYEDIPVYYWRLRSAVCYRLRISDRRYYSLLLAMKNSNCFRFNWASGSMPAVEARGNLLKNLPPVADDGYHMVFVSMNRRKA